MRCLYLHDYADRSGGAEKQLDRLRTTMEARGHETRLIASDAPVGEVPDFADAQLFKGRDGRLQVLTQTANPSAAKLVRNAVATFRPDIVHVRMFLYQLSPLILSALRDVPVVFQASMYKAVCLNGQKMLPNGSVCHFPIGKACLRERCITPQTFAMLQIQQALLKRYRDRIDRTVTLSGRMRDVFEEAGWPVDAVIGNGVEERNERPPLRRPPTIGYAGRFSPEKGLDTLLDAAAALAATLPGLRLVLIGDGPERQRILARAESLGLAVSAPGHLPRHEMEQQLEAAWVQAVPSLWEEPFGNVSTEAAMRGTAVVASRVGGQPDIVEHGETGLLVPPGNAAALAEALGQYLRDRELAEEHGAAARRRALARFTDKAVGDKYEALYHELMNARRDGGAA